MPPLPRLTLVVASLWASAVAGAAGIGGPAPAEGVLRIAMTAADIPTATGLPNNGFEGMRFLGYPVFEALAQWDLSGHGLKPALAERWEQDPADPRVWTFHLRRGVTFHDGTPFDADAVLWNLDRYFKADSPQFEPQAAGISRARVPILAGYRKVDGATVQFTTTEVASFFPYMAVYLLIASPRPFEAAGRDWTKVPAVPAAGTGPFRIVRVSPRESVELARNDAYWDTGRRAKLDGIRLLPIPDANARVAALRAGQVDWIEAVPPDAIPSLKQADFTVATAPYPHIWPWIFNSGAEGSPLKDVRVRQALNYCIDREGIVTLLAGTAEPASGWLNDGDPDFGTPQNRYGFEPGKGRALLSEAGYGPAKPLALTVMISASGSGQMLPLPMNEYLQETLKTACGVEVSFRVVEWQVLLNGLRARPDAPGVRGVDALNISSPSSDPAVMERYFSSARFPPAGFNFATWADPRFDAALKALAETTDEATIAAQTRIAHERLVDNPPWLYVVHDLNPRALAPRVQGFAPSRTWFIDLTLSVR